MSYVDWVICTDVQRRYKSQSDYDHMKDWLLLLLTVKAKETVAAVVVDQVCAVPMLHTGRK